jgi:hypothetical protein
MNNLLKEGSVWSIKLYKNITYFNTLESESYIFLPLPYNLLYEVTELKLN